MIMFELLGARMRASIGLAQMRGGDMSIHLGGPERRMPQQFLYGAQVGPSLEEMSREGMS
jgi:hypothetical protein